jgi:hypothetical protein
MTAVFHVQRTHTRKGFFPRGSQKDRKLEPVLSLRDFPQSGDIFAGWIGLIPDDAPLLMRDRSVQEIYALDLRFR